ncbi:ribosomal protein S18-alanine N-acetyltransferase [Porcipelethomonas sp.]|uniref:ribosomal protein S18-alanine N-acetyltransferase n=1 Tax=Porcipelethomonas sp. TaxID=2981675 RepID=UPI003EF2E2AA
MMPKADIIKCGFSELEEIAEIEKECIPGGWSEKAFGEWLENKNTILLGAVLDGKIIGFANGAWVIDEGELLNIAVKKEYRKQGIAGLLYEKLEKFFLEQGVTAVFLEVREHNVPAVSFYEKNGFEKTGLRKNYYRNPADNAILMKKNIK